MILDLPSWDLIAGSDVSNIQIVQIIGTRIKLAYALARQWFGIYTSAEEPNDGNSFLPANSYVILLTYVKFAEVFMI